MNDRSPSTSDLPDAAEPEEQHYTLEQALEMAQRLQRQGQYDGAESVYLQLLEAVPGHPDVMNFFGVLRHQQGRHDEALALLERSVTAAPDAPGPWTNLANVLIETGYHDDAVKALSNVIALTPDSVQPYNNLGILHLRRGELEQAEAALKQALERGPELSYVHYNLARLYFRAGRLKECAAHSLQTVNMDRKDPKARSLLARSLFLLGEREQGIQLLKDWVALEPDSPEAAHYLAAAGACEVPSRASDDYVKNLFDRFAGSFEVQLEKLGYQAPKFVCDEFARLRDRLPAEPVVLDAGCGTGLCAPLLRPMVGRLDGVDLSPGMLERARARGDYDALYEAELTAFLDQRPDTYDAIASADVMIYFGDLQPLMQAAHRSLRSGGLLVATLECVADETRDYALEVHGRYSHSADYLRRVLASSGFELLHLESQALRSELFETVRGWIFSAVKLPAPAA